MWFLILLVAQIIEYLHLHKIDLFFMVRSKTKNPSGFYTKGICFDVKRMLNDQLILRLKFQLLELLVFS